MRREEKLFVNKRAFYNLLQNLDDGNSGWLLLIDSKLETEDEQIYPCRLLLWCILRLSLSNQVMAASFELAYYVLHT